MSKSARRPQRVFSIVMWALSIVFAGFLIGLGSLIIRDLPKVDQTITVEHFIDQDAYNSAQIIEDRERVKVSALQRDLEDAEAAFAAAANDYRSAKASFDNWIATRNATQSNAQNPEVIARTRALETLKAHERTSLREVERIRAVQVTAERAYLDVVKSREDLYAAATPQYRAAMRAQELRVFVFRLALTLPLLLLGGWMLMKKRESAYWPLYRGFIIFALFAFFVELVPYLPSYGGYVRYGVGIILVVAAGHFIIRGMRKYIARKQIEEERSEVERRRSIGYETALKKIAAKTCSGCDRAIISKDDVPTDFCVHCGIRLQCQCVNCGTRNISFHKFCLSCGTPSAEQPMTEPVPG
ncbi:zinc ribbon domain-containing protein [Robiginitomaculum antarcticum]|uniref:zinc ribbon domain-containing protein n=1 Tax=Robiginitomaculum antarcticum TaxID=437507 RepID=UPI0003674A06|nr:zinc ribbon domain-containing protein [Robiginitomaculum antarcticum]